MSSATTMYATIPNSTTTSYVVGWNTATSTTSTGGGVVYVKQPRAKKLTPPSEITHELIQQEGCEVYPGFLDVPLRVQAECRRMAYAYEFPADPSRHRETFHYYPRGGQDVVGMFGRVAEHVDAGVSKMTLGLTLVNDGLGRLVTAGKSRLLRVGSLYIMDPSVPHKVETESPTGLLTFIAFDFAAGDVVNTRWARKVFRDTMRHVFEYEQDRIRHKYLRD